MIAASTSLPDRIQLEHFRGFNQSTEVVLKPLTLFFGHNHAGKSTLVRFLPLLAETVREGGVPLYLDGVVLRGAAFADVANRQARSLWMEFGVHWGQTGFRARVQGRVDQPMLDLVSMKVTLPQGEVVHLQEGGEPGVLADGEGRRVGFDGLVPQSDPIILNALSELSALPGQVQWISGLRRLPERARRTPNSPPRKMEPDGANASDFMAWEEVAGSPRLLSEVQAFYRAIGHVLQVEFPRSVLDHALTLSPAGHPVRGIALADSGAGMIQVLPVLVALARAQHGGPRILAMEQPELHLHTRAQVALADFLVARVAENRRFLIETHSEVLLTAIQVAIAEGRLDPAHVQLYWMRTHGEDGSSVADAVTLDGLGHPVGPWPRNALDEVVALGRRLFELRRKRSSG